MQNKKLMIGFIVLSIAVGFFYLFDPFKHNIDFPFGLWLIFVGLGVFVKMKWTTILINCFLIMLLMFYFLNINLL